MQHQGTPPNGGGGNDGGGGGGDRPPNHLGTSSTGPPGRGNFGPPGGFPGGNGNGGNGGPHGPPPPGPGHGPPGSGGGHRYNDNREQFTIKIDTLPRTSNYRNWQISLRSIVCSASGRPDQCMAWITRPEAENCTIDELAISGPGWESLDSKLSAALLRLVLHGAENSSRIAIEVRQRADAANRQGRPLQGRQNT